MSSTPPSVEPRPVEPRQVEPITFLFKDDGETPNNPRLPLILYRNAVNVSGRDPAAAFEAIFERNGWGRGWRNGIFDFRHFHLRAHEVLGIARGSAQVEFGGAGGKFCACQVRAGVVHGRGVVDHHGGAGLEQFLGNGQPLRFLDDFGIGLVGKAQHRGRAEARGEKRPGGKREG